jgi:uncharacterized protein (DUF1501 family)
MNDDAYTRRQFLHRGLTLASATATVPLFIERSAQSMMMPLHSMVSSQAGVPEDRVLVVVQLGGGNDGLNTVVPYGSREYNNYRPTLAIPAPGNGTPQRQAALPIDENTGIGLNPSFSAFKELMDEGVASIVQGVGYPNPNRSHFASMDVWHTGETSGRGNGWIGRYFDNTCNGTPVPEGAISIGRTAPLAMHGDIQKPVSFDSAELFRWMGEDLHESLSSPYHAINRGKPPTQVDQESQLGFLMRTSLDAQLASDRIRAAVAKRPLVSYPGSSLSQQLQMVAAMIRDGLGTRVYYVSIGGFDTHANQTFTHSRLLNELGGALNAFHKDLKAQDNANRVMTMVFSEFGRRVPQNASGGTDHGTAAPMYLVGDMVRPGLLGKHPSLTDLDERDLKYNVDFRSIYAAILEDWMGAPAGTVLNGQFRKAKVLT